MDREQAESLLGLSGDVTRSEILHAFSRQARRTHPDLLADATPDAVRVANERFILLTSARDTLLAAPRAAPLPAGPPAHEGPAGDTPGSEAETASAPSANPGKPRGMAGPILTVVAIAIVLVILVSWQEAWRSQFATVGRDVTVSTTVSTVTDGSERDAACPERGSCLLLEVTLAENCANAHARFEVTGGTGSGAFSTETRQLTGLRAGEPTAVVLEGTGATLIYLGCDG